MWQHQPENYPCKSKILPASVPYLERQGKGNIERLDGLRNVWCHRKISSNLTTKGCWAVDQDTTGGDSHNIFSRMRKCSRNQDVDFVLLITSAHINIYRHINAFMGDREREPLAWGRVLTSAGWILTESVKLEGSELFLVSRLSFPLSRKPAVLKQNQIMCWLLFSFLWENIWEKQLKEGLGLQFEQLLSNTAQQEGTAMARQGQRTHCIHIQKAGRDEHWCLAHSLYYIQDPCS